MTKTEVTKPKTRKQAQRRERVNIRLCSGKARTKSSYHSLAKLETQADVLAQSRGSVNAHGSAANGSDTIPLTYLK